MQQVFLTIKPSKLKQMAPDCLKGLAIDEIKELCLDELLGISTKRLKSVIQGTECPSNTDSSGDSEPDIMEHISLDEISDDTDDEFNFIPVDVENDSKNIKPKNKEMTVLELLELQARARAIRSQLSLEPVKIEKVDEIGKIVKKARLKKDRTLKSESKKHKSYFVENDKSPKQKLVRNYRAHKANPELDITHQTQNVESIVDLSNIVEVDHSPSTKTIEIASDNNILITLTNLEPSKSKRIKLNRNCITGPSLKRKDIDSPKSCNKNNKSIDNDYDEIHLHLSDTEKELLENEHKHASTSTTNVHKTKDRESSASEDCISINEQPSPLYISSDSEDGNQAMKKKTLDDDIIHNMESITKQQEIVKSPAMPKEVEESQSTCLTDMQHEISESSTISDSVVILECVSDNTNNLESIHSDETIQSTATNNLEDNTTNKISNTNFNDIDTQELVEDDIKYDEGINESIEKDVNWKTRWLSSEKVQKVLITSKLCSKVKNKTVENDKKKSLQKNIDAETIINNTISSTTANTVENSEMLGSVKEFNML